MDLRPGDVVLAPRALLACYVTLTNARISRSWNQYSVCLFKKTKELLKCQHISAIVQLNIFKKLFHFYIHTSVKILHVLVCVCVMCVCLCVCVCGYWVPIGKAFHLTHHSLTVLRTPSKISFNSIFPGPESPPFAAACLQADSQAAQESLPVFIPTIGTWCLSGRKV